MRGCRLQLHWHENPDFRFQPDAGARSTDPIFNENLGLLAELGWIFELQVFPAQIEHATRLVERHPDLTFVLIHAGMPIAGEPWREALRALAAYPNVMVKLSGQGTFVHRSTRTIIRTRHHGGARALRIRARDVRLQLPDREHLDRLL